MNTLFNSIDRMEGAMSFHRERHAVLSSNVANVDTPKYKPLDLERLPDADEGVAGPGLAMARTAEGHLSSSDGVGGRVVADASGPAGADGNAVSLEHELAKIDANRIRYSTNSELVSRRLALIRYAASDGMP